MRLLLLLLVLPAFEALDEEFVSNVVQTAADCRFSVHKGGPNGEEVTGVDLDTELFYSIKCKSRDGYCLRVSNCTVSADDGSVDPFPVIDKSGCSTDESIFDHVQYDSDFSAGIRNPYPIRFRSSSSPVLFYCLTTLEASNAGSCHRKSCPRDSFQ